MSDGKRIVWHLRRVPMLAGLGNDALALLGEQATLGEARRRDVLYLPGDRAALVHVLLDGRVRLSKVTRDGKSLTLAYIAPGEMFGETCLASDDEAARGEMAEASEASTFINLDRTIMQRAAELHAGLANALMRLALVRRREVESKLEGLMFREVSGKLAELLVQLGDQHGVDDARGTIVALKITHQELANLIGSTRETVSLTLAQWKRQRLILTEGRKVILSDRDALRALY